MKLCSSSDCLTSSCNNSSVRFFVCKLVKCDKIYLILIIFIGICAVVSFLNVISTTIGFVEGFKNNFNKVFI